jgi:hypothetical protein
VATRFMKASASSMSKSAASSMPLICMAPAAATRGNDAALRGNDYGCRHRRSLFAHLDRAGIFDGEATVDTGATTLDDVGKALHLPGF